MEYIRKGKFQQQVRHNPESTVLYMRCSTDVYSKTYKRKVMIGSINKYGESRFQFACHLWSIKIMWLYISVLNPTYYLIGSETDNVEQNSCEMY